MDGTFTIADMEIAVGDYFTFTYPENPPVK
jgi:hypothetical protein